MVCMRGMVTYSLRSPKNGTQTHFLNSAVADITTVFLVLHEATAIPKTEDDNGFLYKSRTTVRGWHTRKYS